VAGTGRVAGRRECESASLGACVRKRLELRVSRAIGGDVPGVTEERY
jgi:hypothetical protein